ncbi:MAG: GNAT family N-acetyltransferase [Nitrospirae bacterium]|nr:GNAT family N-acetyltransferase [Nitrospirota bacterium]
MPSETGAGIKRLLEILAQRWKAERKSATSASCSLSDETAFSRNPSCRFFWFRIPRHIGKHPFALRALRLSDGPTLHKELGNAGLLEADGLSRPFATSWLHLWWWLRRTYAAPYVIKTASGCVGFIGLCRIEPGDSVEATLVIFAARRRRLGYGSRAFFLLSENVLQRLPVKRVVVRVRADNHGSLSFWKRLGFEELKNESGITLLSRQLMADSGSATLLERSRAVC